MDEQTSGQQVALRLYLTRFATAEDMAQLAELGLTQ